MAETVWLTEAGKTRLADELHDLRTRRRPDLHARIQEATESGDISDNSEYEELKDEWASLEARIFELEQTLDQLVDHQLGTPVVRWGYRNEGCREHGDTHGYMIGGQSAGGSAAGHNDPLATPGLTRLPAPAINRRCLLPPRPPPTGPSTSS